LIGSSEPRRGLWSRNQKITSKKKEKEKERKQTESK